jgi:hypothetical protein
MEMRVIVRSYVRFRLGRSHGNWLFSFDELSQ